MASQRVGSEWVGTLSHFEGTKGYVALILDPVSFSFNSVGSERSYQSKKYNLIDSPPMQYDFNLSMNQSFYFVHNVEINLDMLSNNLWLIAYCNGNVVGSRKWNDYIVDLPAMGVDGTESTDGYCNVNDTPNFKIFDKENNFLIDLYSNEVPTWKNNQINNIYLYGEIINIEFPNQFILSEPYPNPFNSTTIDYTILEPAYISINIIDINGNIFDTMKSKSFHSIGNYSLKWDTDLAPSGVYFIRMNNLNNKQNIIQKVMLIK